MGSVAVNQRVSEAVIPTSLEHADLVPQWFGPLQLGPKGFMRTLQSSSGCKLATYIWPARSNPKAIILAIHGHGAYAIFEYLKSTGIGKPAVYAGSWFERLNHAGYTVCAMDFQGHGLSEGRQDLRCYFESFDDLAADVYDFVRQLRHDPELFGKPFYLLGESMGGGVSVYITLQQPELFKGAVLLAPMLSLERISRKGLNPYLRSVGSFLSWLVPTAQLVQTNKSPLPDEVQRTFDEDPFTYHEATRIRLAQTYLEVTEYMARNVHSISTPLLIFHSELDTMCDADGSKRLYQQAQSVDKTLRLCNDMWHALVKENHNEEILSEIIAWLDERVGAL